MTLLACQLCAWKDRITNPHRSFAEGHGGQGGHSRQGAQLHQGKILPDQPAMME